VFLVWAVPGGGALIGCMFGGVLGGAVVGIFLALVTQYWLLWREERAEARMIREAQQKA
jgi:uncharacterized protein (DUF2062 family)